MKVRLIVTTDDGKSYEGQTDLRPIEQSATQLPAPTTSTNGNRELDLTLPVRPFMKQYGTGKSGPQKFGLLLAHMVGGQADREVKRGDVEKLWNKMTGIMDGEFNGAYAIRAKDFGWVDSPRNGVYVLRASWRSLLS